jgi:peroxiredoxin
MLRFSLPAAMLVLALSGGTSIAANAIQLPTDPARWMNSPPVSLEAMKGKGVVIYFFEEQCPSCAKQWPNLTELSREFADKPVVFIAVSSGTERGAIQQYVQTNAVHWPIVLDPNREIEKAAGVGDISLKNIMQFVYVTADGELNRGDWKNPAGSAEKASVGAAWRVDPMGVPTSLKRTWAQVEFGHFAAAAPQIKTALADTKPEVKDAGEKMQAAVQTALAAEIASVQAAAAGSDSWTTFKAFRSVAERFKGYPLPDDFKKTGSALFNNEEVKNELFAMQNLEALSKGLKSGSPAVRKKAIEKLDKIITDHPGTEAADLAAQYKDTMQP